MLAEWVETRIFSDTRLRPGYDQQEVFAFLNAIRDSFLGVREPSLTPDEIRVKQFSTTRLRPGYDQGEVDAFLDEAESRLAAQLGARREAPAAGPGSGAADSTGDPVQIRCLECGAESAEASRVCARCGAPAAEPVSGTADPAADPTAEPVQIRCLECGAESAEPTQICARCGAPISYQPSVADDPAVGQRARPGYSRREALIVVGVGVVMLAVITVIVALTSSTSSTDQLTWDQLRRGDCLTGSNMGLPNSNPWPDYVTRVACTKRHEAEVFFASNIWPQSLAFPGKDAIDSQSDARCDAAFAAYDGIDESQSAFTFTKIVDDDSSDWASGVRSLVCVAYEPSSSGPSGGTPVNYSIKGSNK